MKRKTKILNGMAQICAYVNRSEATVMNWIQREDFPATKVDGVWQSNPEEIDQWRRNQTLEVM